MIALSLSNRFIAYPPADASHILACRYSATLARAYYNKSVSLIPYQLLPPLLA